MFFAETQEERITEQIKAILSCSYEERVQSDLRLAVKEKAEKGGCTMPEERMENVWFNKSHIWNSMCFYL